MLGNKNTLNHIIYENYCELDTCMVQINASPV